MKENPSSAGLAAWAAGASVSALRFILGELKLKGRLVMFGAGVDGGAEKSIEVGADKKKVAPIRYVPVGSPGRTPAALCADAVAR